MRFEKQPTKLPVKNIQMSVEPRVKRHSTLLPNSIRAIFCGPSNCGKTNALVSLLTDPNGLRFANLYVYSKSLNQPKYQFLEKVIAAIKGIEYYPFSDREDVIAPQDARSHSIMVFDDVACEKQDNIRAFFSMGRHKNVDCFYLCQTYTRIPKHLVRDNANFLVLFKQDEMNLKHVYEDHVNTDMTFALFKELCCSCWKDSKYAFVVIDKDSGINEGRYRKGFDCFIKLSKSET